MNIPSPSQSSLRAARLVLLLSVACSFVIAGPGCGDSEGDADSGAIAADGSAPAVDGRAADAAPAAADATIVVDASAAEVDATVAADGATSSQLDAVCMSMCEKLDSCFGDGDVPGCVAECTVDLGDCSTAALSAVDNCLGVPCQGIEQCMGSIPCVTQ